MLPKTEIWQKWPRLVVTLVSIWSLCGQLVAPATGKAQEDRRLSDVTGAFTVTISRPDIPLDLADGPALAGVWSLNLGSDGTFSVTRLDVGEIASGTYAVGDTTITFDEWHGLIDCAVGGEDVGAIYGWRRSDSALTLTPIRETCPERITLLSTRPLGSNDACTGSGDATTAPSVAAANNATLPGTPSAEVPPGSGVTAQEGLDDAAETETAVDGLLARANGCWATGDPQSFLALHSDMVIQQLVFTVPPDILVSQLRQTMMTPASFERIGEVNVNGSDRAWAYVQFNYDDEPQPVLVDFVNQDGNWLFDTYIPAALLPATSKVSLQP